MEHWTTIVSTLYYTGVGAVLLATSVRFIYRLVKGYDQDREFLDELKEVHLRNIYSALEQIAVQLDIRLDTPTLGQNPSQRKHGNNSTSND